MATGYDGSIRIDTSIDEKGFNSGMKKIAGSMKAFGMTLLEGAGKGLNVVAQVLSALKGVAIAIAAIVAAGVLIDRLLKKFAESVAPTSAFKDQIAELRTATANLKGEFTALTANLLSAFMPVIMTVINWLAKAINFVSQFLAALRGQSTYYKYISGSAEGVARSTAKAASNTKKLKEAAKGALASWDELNVLQQETNDTAATSGTGGGGGGGNIMMQETAIDSDIQEKAQKVKDFLKKAGDYVKENTATLIGSVLFGLTGRQIGQTIDNWDEIWGIIKTGFTETWTSIKTGFQTAWGEIKLGFQTAWTAMSTIWNQAGPWFKGNVIDPVVNAFKTAWVNVKDFASTAWKNISDVWGAVSTWFKVSVIDPLKSAFALALDWIQTKWQMVFTGISTFVKGTINKIIDFLNSMIAGVTSGINAIIGGLNSVGKNLPNFKPIGTVASPQIPRLATGAVIPPNSQFLALLGDQKSGTNIEAPLSTIEDAVRNVISGMDLGGDVTSPITITLDSDVIYQGVQRVQRRKGTSLIAAGAI